MKKEKRMKQIFQEMLDEGIFAMYGIEITEGTGVYMPDARGDLKEVNIENLRSFLAIDIPIKDSFVAILGSEGKLNKKNQSPYYQNFSEDREKDQFASTLDKKVKWKENIIEEAA